MKIRLRKKILFALTPIVLLLLIGETAARLKLYFRHGQAYYLFMPLYRGNLPPDAPVERRVHVVGQGARPAAAAKGAQAGAAAKPVDGRVDAAAPPGGQASTKGDPEADTYYYKMAPGIHDAPAPYTTKYRINSLGFRGDDFNPQGKAPGVTRIFAVGQSSTFGAESADGETWPARLGHYLSTQKPGGYEVINAGFDGYHSRHMKNLVLQELGRYQPDMLIFYAGLNDLNFENSLEETKPSALALAIHRTLYYRWSMLYTLVSEKAAVMSQGNPAAGVGYVDKSKEHFTENMTAILGWCKAQKVRCVIVREMVNAVPSIFVRDSVSLKEAQDSLSNGTRDKHGAEYAAPLTVYRYAELAKALKALTAAHGVPFLDVRPAMSEALNEGKKLMFDYGHLTPLGNDILAREVAKQIQ
jgi:lysophospholipase L1-like esterase